MYGKTEDKNLSQNIVENLIFLKLISSDFKEIIEQITVTTIDYNQNTKIQFPSSVEYSFIKNFYLELNKLGISCNHYPSSKGGHYIEISLELKSFVKWLEKAIDFQKRLPGISFRLPNRYTKNFEEIKTPELLEKTTFYLGIYAIYAKYLENDNVECLTLLDCKRLREKIDNEISSLTKMMYEGESQDRDSRNGYYEQMSGRSIALKAKEALHFKKAELGVVDSLECLWFAAFHEYFNARLPSDQFLSKFYGREVRYSYRDRAGDYLIEYVQDISNHVRFTNVPNIPNDIKLNYSDDYLDFNEEMLKKKSQYITIYWFEWAEIATECYQKWGDEIYNKREMSVVAPILPGFFKSSNTTQESPKIMKRVTEQDSKQVNISPEEELYDLCWDYKKLHRINELLNMPGININQGFRLGETCLIRAAMKGHTDLVKLLLENGAENIADTFGKHPLKFAKNDSIKELMINKFTQTETSSSLSYKP